MSSDRPFVIYADGDPIGATPATDARGAPLPARHASRRPDVRAAPRPSPGSLRAASRRARPQRRHHRARPPAAAPRPRRHAHAWRGDLDEGSVLVSATNGKTTTAAMLAACLERAGRPRGAQPRRLEHGLGRGHRAARRRRATAAQLGPVRGRRGLAAAPWRRDARPAAAAALQPVPRPARPLRRARAARRPLGRAGRPSATAARASC